jgi:hypothetical protein
MEAHGAGIAPIPTGKGRRKRELASARKKRKEQQF